MSISCLNQTDRLGGLVSKCFIEVDAIRLSEVEE